MQANAFGPPPTSQSASGLFGYSLSLAGLSQELSAVWAPGIFAVCPVCPVCARVLVRSHVLIAL
jgi:hypothetical protein